MRNGVHSPVELYDLSKDQSETNDIAGQNPEIVREITVMMEQVYRPSFSGLSCEGARRGEVTPSHQPNGIFVSILLLHDLISLGRS